VCVGPILVPAAPLAAPEDPMPLSIDRFFLLARAIGGLLVLMAAGLFGVFAAHLFAGANPLAPAVELDLVGALVLASLGAFQLPLGLSLLRRSAHTTARLRVAAGALEGMALLRLVVFVASGAAGPLGWAPLVEFVVLGAIAVVAFVARPEHESAIELHRVVDVDVSAAEAWDLLGNRFGDVAAYTSGLKASSLDRPVGVGAVRTCETERFGVFSAQHLTEELVRFEPAALRFAYTAGRGLPAFITGATNRWSIERLGEHRCRLRSHAPIDLSVAATPFAPVLGWSIGGAVERFLADCRQHLERRGTGTAARAAA
jgi:hypothetical protein